MVIRNVVLKQDNLEYGRKPAHNKLGLTFLQTIIIVTQEKDSENKKYG